jgi:putative glutamine amidotransferase
MSTRRARPVIGVTGPDRGGMPAWLFTRLALYRAGARAIRITPSTAMDPEKLDGLVVGGGADVTEPLGSPATPKGPPPSRVRWPRRLLDLLLSPLVLMFRVLAAKREHGVDPGRDRLELALLAHAEQRNLPVLGICRGAQLMNVAAGGSLMRDVHTLYEERPQLYTVLPRREVEISPNSCLLSVVGRPTLLVNSLHLHAVKEPGKDMRVVAREPSGVPQAIEHATRRFWLGVQWHPEYLPQQPSHQRIFHALCSAARRHDATSAVERRPAARTLESEQGRMV